MYLRFKKKAFRWKTLTAVTCRKRSVVGWFGRGVGFLSLNGAKGKLTVWCPNALSTVAQFRGIWNWPASSSLWLSLHVLKLALQARKWQTVDRGWSLLTYLTDAQTNAHAHTHLVCTHRHIAENCTHALNVALDAWGLWACAGDRSTLMGCNATQTLKLLLILSATGENAGNLRQCIRVSNWN